MEEIKIDFAKQTDIDDIMDVELMSFKPAEASSKEAMESRIHLAPETFLVARDAADNHVVGMIVGPTSSQRYITDNLFFEVEKNRANDPYQLIVGLAVHPDYRAHGIAAALLDRMKKLAKERGQRLISLTCLKELIVYYEHHGFKNEGLAQSKLANEIWYNMVYEF